MLPHQQYTNGRLASSRALIGQSNLKFMVALVILFSGTDSANGLSISRSRVALTPKCACASSRTNWLQHSCYQKNTHSRLHQTLGNNDNTSLDEQLVTSDLINNANITEKIEEELQQKQEEISQQIEQEKEELQVAVNEVKEAVVEVSQSAKNLGGAVITNGPGITANFFKLWASEGFRCVRFTTCSCICLLVSASNFVHFYFRNDVARRNKWYISDWVDGFKKKRLVIPAVLFLYFACLAPAVSFGTISSEITNGAINVPEYLISSGIAGMVSCLGAFESAYLHHL